MCANIANIENLLTIDNNINDEKPIALVLFASPRKSGFTYKLTQHYLDTIKDRYNIKFLDCYNMKLSPCISCDYCKKEVGCYINDDFKEIKYFLEKASLLIIATPVYNMSFPAPLKTVIDRTQMYFNARFSHNIRPPIKTHRKCTLISVCGSKDENSFDIIIKQLKKVFTVMNTTLDKCILLYNTDNLCTENIIKDAVIKNL